MASSPRPEFLLALGACIGAALVATAFSLRVRAGGPSASGAFLDNLLHADHAPGEDKVGHTGARSLGTPPRAAKGSPVAPDTAYAAYPTGGASVNTRRLSVDSPAAGGPTAAPPPALARGVVAPVIVGVAGGSGSGKTCIATLISQSRALQGVRVVSISSDSYYKGLLPGVNAAENNWDHPAALDLELLAAHLQDLRAGRSIRVPEYSFVEHARMPDAAAHFVSAADTDVVIVDGIFVLHDEGVRTACDLTLFTVEDLDVCLARRLRRDIAERGRTIENVLIQYLRVVRPGCAFAAPATAGTAAEHLWHVLHGGRA